MKQSVDRSTLITVCLNALQLGAATIGFVFVANALGPVEYGIFACYLAVAGLLPLIAGVGSDQVLLMRGSRFEEDLPLLFGNALIVRIATTLVLTSLIAVIGSALDWQHLGLLITLLWACSLAALLSPLSTTVMRVQGLFTTAGAYVCCPHVLFLAFVYVVRGSNLSGIDVAWLYLLAQGVPAIIATIYVLANIGVRWSIKEIKRNLRLGGAFSIGHVADLVFMRSDIAVLQVLSGPSAVGEYTAGVRLAYAALAVPTAAHTVLLPEYHRTIGTPGMDKLFDTTRERMFEFAMVLLGGLYAVGPLIELVFFKSEYRGMSIVMKAACVSVLVMFVTYPYAMLCEANGAIAQRIVWRLLSLLVSGSVALVTIPLVGTVGAALGIIAGSLVYLAILHRAMRVGSVKTAATLNMIRSSVATICAMMITITIIHASFSTVTTLFAGTAVYICSLVGFAYLLNAFPSSRELLVRAKMWHRGTCL